MDRLERDMLIAEYWSRNYKYKEIRDALIHNGCRLSLVQLKRITKQLGLSRRNNLATAESIVEAISSLLDGPYQHVGYCFMHDKLKATGYNVFCDTVMYTLQLMDLVGVQTRQRHRLIRRRYYVRGPNWSWHVDSYDKLKPYGICINGCIDGFSCKIVWIEASYSNSDPCLICGYYIEAVAELQGCPNILRVDAGTENVNMIKMQKFLHNDAVNGNSVVVGSSHSNVKIENWWAQYRKHSAEFFISLFHGLKAESLFAGDQADKELIQFCLLNLVQDQLDTYVDLWNNHYIRKSNNDIINYGTPIMMYDSPEIYNTTNCIHISDNNVCRLQLPQEEIKISM